MRPSDADNVSESLGVQPVFVGASDVGPVARLPHGPGHRTRATVAMPHHDRINRLVDYPPGDVLAAVSFPILHVDEHGDVKLRRGTGAAPRTTPRCGRQTSPRTTLWATSWTSPVAWPRTRRSSGSTATIYAYRQWPVRHPSHCATFLPSASRITLCFHLAMCFGAAASVWNFNRAADALQLLLRALLLVVGGHYVDDFNAVDYTPRAPTPRSRPSRSSLNCLDSEPRRPRHSRPSPATFCRACCFSCGPKASQWRLQLVE